MRLLVTVLDVRGRVPPAVIEVSATLGVDRVLAPQQQKRLVLRKVSNREYEADLSFPMRAEVTLTVESNEYWSVSCSFTITLLVDALLRPMLTRGTGPADAALTGLTVDREGQQHVVRAELRVQKLRADTPLSAGDDTAMAWQGEVVVNPLGRGQTMLRGTETATTLSSRHLFLTRWKTGRVRMGIYVPVSARRKLGHYTFFFKPAPHGMDGLGVIAFYMLGNKGDPMPKHLASQLELSGAPTVLCMPAPEDGPALSSAITPAALLELADEVDAFLRSHFEGRAATQVPQPKIALSCFSRGMMIIQSLLSGTKNEAFNNAVTSILLLDGHLANDAAPFVSNLLTWFRSGAGRSIRAYHSDATPLPGLMLQGKNLLAGLPDLAPALTGALEFHGGPDVAGGYKSLSYVSLSAAFFKAWDPGRSERVNNHQLVPAIFFGHALKTSGIT